MANTALPRAGRTPAAGQQRHDRQWSAAAAGGGAVGEFGGHHHAQTLQRRDALALIAEQQPQAQGVDPPAQQNHAEHDQQPVQRKALQARPGVAAAQHAQGSAPPRAGRSTAECRDSCGALQALALLRQPVDLGHWHSSFSQQSFKGLQPVIAGEAVAHVHRVQA